MAEVGKTLENTPESENDTSGEAIDAAAQPTTAVPEADVLKEQLKEQQNKYLYLYAEFENYKKRAIKERSDLLKFGHESFARELLQVTDNLDRALEHSEVNTDALITGIKLVNQQLKDILNKFGVTPVSALGLKFDPELHEAVGQEKDGPDKSHEEGTVIREHQKGYTLHGRLLRPARVVIATK